MSPDHKQKIGVATAIIIGMNAMIGSGIFALPSELGSSIGPACIVTTLLVAIAIWFMALSIAKLAALFPQAGSFYTYASQWGGHVTGLLSSGAYVVGLLIAMGLLCRMAGIYLHYYFPQLSTAQLALLTLFILTVLNMFGAVLASLGQYILIILTVFPLLATTIMCFTKANFSNLIPFAPYGYENVLLATRVVIFGFFGFECSTSLVSRMYNPEKNVPRALTYSLIMVAFIYLAFITSLILAVPLNLFSSPDTSVIVPLKHIFPNSRWLLEGIHISILAAILGTIHSMIWSASALLLSLIKLFKNKFTHKLVDRGIITDKTMVLFVGLCIFASFLTFKHQQFFYFTALFIVFAYATSIITLLTIKKERNFKSLFITTMGLITTSAIFLFALEGVIKTILG